MAYGECVVVSGPQLSSANIRVVALVDGKPAKDVQVSVFLFVGAHSEALYTLVTDDKGVAVPPELAAGTYHIEASTWRATPYDLDIIVPMDGRVTPIAYSMNMQSDASLRKMSMNLKARVVPSTVLRMFSGIVYDPSGASVSGATVEVWKMNADGELIAAQGRCNHWERRQILVGLGGWPVFRHFSRARIPQKDCGLFELPQTIRRRVHRCPSLSPLTLPAAKTNVVNTY